VPEPFQRLCFIFIQSLVLSCALKAYSSAGTRAETSWYFREEGELL